MAGSMVRSLLQDATAATHPEQDHVTDAALFRRSGEGPQLLGPIFHVLDDGQPAEAVGEVGGILLPESMVAGPQSLDRMGCGESCIRRSDQGLKFRGK